MAAKKRKQQRKQENRSPPPAPVAPAPANRPEDSPARNIPAGTAERDEPSSSPQITRFERCKRRLVAVREVTVERIVDICILLGILFRAFRKCISLLNMVSFAVLIVASQLWLSASILEILVLLCVFSKIKFQFPFQGFAKFLVKSKEYLASDFRLLVLSCVCIAFINDLLLGNSHLKPVQRLKIYLNLFFAQVIMYSFIPFMHNFADVMNVILAIGSFARIGVEVITSCTNEDVNASANFLPHALMFHFLFLSILCIYLTYYETNMFLKSYWGSSVPTQV